MTWDTFACGRLVWQTLFGQTVATFQSHYSIDESACQIQRLCGADVARKEQRAVIVGTVSQDYVYLRFLLQWPWPRRWGNTVFVGCLESTDSGSTLVGAFMATRLDRTISVLAILFGLAISILGIFRLVIGAGESYVSVDAHLAFPAMLLTLGFQFMSRRSQGLSDEMAMRRLLQNALGN